MLAPLLWLTLAAPFTPLLDEPADEGWTIGQYTQFSTTYFQDDAGLPAASVRLEFRPEDAGYGAMVETLPYNRSVNTTLTFAPEGARFCWRAFHLNTLGESSAPGGERCFRVDATSPSNPAFVDAGAIVSTGQMALEVQPATDSPSGISGYFLELAPTPLGPFQGFVDRQQQLPLVAYVGEGSWFGWVLAIDLAGNTNRLSLADYTVPITVTANPAVLVPEAPRFERAVVNGYGDSLYWDAGWSVDAGVTHVVASYCNLDAGCGWRHGFHTVPASDAPRRWLQVSEEGPMIARVAVVQGDQVGPWSAPSAPLLVDRTPPPVPPGFTASPAAARAGPITLSWGPVIDDFTGWSGVEIEEKELVSNVIRTHSANAPALSLQVIPPGDGRFQFRARATDLAGNGSGVSAPVITLIDGTGPVSARPVATASPLDGGAIVSLSWAFPSDALSAVTGQSLEERAIDGGAQLVSVTGLSVSRLVPPGTWRWALRGTDALGNVGAFSEPSNAIVVTEQGVAIGPSITTTRLQARCGELLSIDLAGGGDAPLSWARVSGPEGLLVEGSGALTWTPPHGSSGLLGAVVRLTNGAGSVEGDLELEVTCVPEVMEGAPVPRSLNVGCGCTSFDASWVSLAWLILALRRRPPGQET